MITVLCDCGERIKVDVAYAKSQLRWKGLFGFGQHVSDPKAFVMRWLVAVHGWGYTGGRIAKTTLTMTCPKCREQLSELPELDDDLDVDPDAHLGP
jgi:hypothetical protein